MSAQPDYIALVSILRDAAPPHVADERDKAADAIEALLARVAELEQACVRKNEEGRDLFSAIAALEAENADPCVFEIDGIVSNNMPGLIQQDSLSSRALRRIPERRAGPVEEVTGVEGRYFSKEESK